MNKELIAQELDILKTADGELHPQDVVDFAKTHPKSESYKQFNWNVNEAANAYWLQQARYLITTCVIFSHEATGDKPEMRAWFREGKPEGDEERSSGYVSTEEMLKDPIQRRKIIITTIRRCLGVLGSYPIPELKPLVSLANKLLHKYQQVEEFVAK